MCRSKWLGTLLALVSLGSCRGSNSSPAAKSPVAETMPEPAVADAAPVPMSMPKPTLSLALNSPVPLADEEGAVALLRDYTIEDIAASPDDPDSYPAGSGVTMTVEIAGATIGLSELSAGYDSELVGWTADHRVTLLAHDPSSATVEVQIDKISDSVEETLHPKAHLLRGEALELGPKLKARFSSHGHKMTYPGQTSPLIVAMQYERGDQELESASYNLYPPDDNEWTWRNFRFRLLAYEYDGFMDLRVERLALEPMAAAPR